MSSTAKKASFGCLAILAVLALFVVLSSSLYTINERQQAIITQFGKPIGEPITEAGLRLKTPFIQKVNMIEKRILEWDGSASEMPTKDKTYILVDTFGRWRIAEPRRYFVGPEKVASRFMGSLCCVLRVYQFARKGRKGGLNLAKCSR